MKCFFRLYGCQSCVLSCLRIYLLLPNCCLCVFNLLSSPRGCSLDLTLDPHLVLMITWELRFPSFLGHERLCALQAAPRPIGSDSFCFQAAFAFIPLLTSSCRILFWFAVFASRKWRILLFWSIDYCSLCWLGCWARCGMLQDMNRMEVSCIFYVKVGTFNHLEQSKIWHLTVNKTGIVRLTIQQELIVSICFMYYPRDYLRQTSADILSLRECTIYIWQSWDFGCHKPQLISGNKKTTLDRLIVNHWTGRNVCNLQLYTAGSTSSITNNSAVTYSILTWC